MIDAHNLLSVSDAMETAVKLEERGKAGRIHVSPEVNAFVSDVFATEGLKDTYLCLVFRTPRGPHIPRSV